MSTLSTLEVIVRGYTGTGKSHLARAIQEALCARGMNVVVVNPDPIGHRSSVEVQETLNGIVKVEIVEENLPRSGA